MIVPEMLVTVAAGSGLLSWWLTGKLASAGSPLLSLDHPNERSLHRTPTPRTGGIAIIGSLFVGVLAYGAVAGGWSFSGQNPNGSGGAGWWILATTVLVAAVSFVDDRGGLSVGLRLGIQLAVATVLVVGAGFALPSVEFPLLGELQWRWLAVPLAVVFVVWMTNLYNFMDGMDGFAGGMTVIGFGGLAYFAWKANHQFMLASALILSSVSFGFLLHNFPPARIFMGDVGSVSSGFIAASLILLGCRDGVFTLWVPVILFSPFIADATSTLLRRALRRKKVWEAHREHYYQRAVLSGWSHRRTVLAEYVVMTLCGGLAILYHGATEGSQLIILGAWGTLFLALAGLVSKLERGAREEVLR